MEILPSSPLNRLIQFDTKLLIPVSQDISQTTPKRMDKWIWHIWGTMYKTMYKIAERQNAWLK